MDCEKRRADATLTGRFKHVPVRRTADANTSKFLPSPFSLILRVPPLIAAAALLVPASQQVGVLKKLRRL